MSSLISGERIAADDSGLVSEARIVADDAVGSLASVARITMSGALARGPKGDTPPLSDRTPAALGTADAGTGMNAAREDHVHPMPTAHDVGALAEGGTAADSSLLGGKAPEAYADARALAAQGNSIGDAWTEGTAYALGDYAISANRLYRCITAHTAGSAFDSACWEAVSVSGEIRRKTGNRFGTATSITTSGTTVPADGIITVSYNSNSTAWAYLEVFINGVTAFIAQIGSTDRLRIFNTLRVNRGDVITFSAVNSPTYEIKFRPVA